MGYIKRTILLSENRYDSKFLCNTPKFQKAKYNFFLPIIVIITFARRHTIRLVKAKLQYTGKKKITSKVFLKVRILRMKKCESEGFSHSPRLPSCHREKRWKIKEEYRVVVYHLPILT